jgi:hypothetical protein
MSAPRPDETVDEKFARLEARLDAVAGMQAQNQRLLEQIARALEERRNRTIKIEVKS